MTTNRFENRLRKTYGISRPTPMKPPLIQAIENRRAVEYVGGGQGRDPVAVEAYKAWTGPQWCLLGWCFGLLSGVCAYHAAVMVAVWMRG